MVRKNNNLILGTFNSEQFWRNKSSASLPNIQDSEANNLVSAMDELLIVLCQSSDDIIITRYCVEKAFHNYYEKLGLKYSHFFLFDSIINNNYGTNNNKCICEVLISDHKLNSFLINNLNGIKFIPYSITQQTAAFCKMHNILIDFPDIDIVKRVNSKSFSHLLNHRLGISTRSLLINSCEELENSGLNLLLDGPFLIKEYMGVSGKGNLLIESEMMLRSVLKYLRTQEERNKTIEFIIEPFLKNKWIDFSAQMEISKEGKISILSIQQMNNIGFVFSSIRLLGNDLKKVLEKSDYFYKIESVGREIYKEGYYGPVCIDSMMLDCQEIIYLVEINARISMGLINHYLNKFLSNFSVQGNLMYFSFSTSYKITFEELYIYLMRNNLLFSKQNPLGILPLTCTSLNLNYNYNQELRNSRIYKGRLYFSIVANNIEEEQSILFKLRKLFNEMKLLILN